RRLSSGERRHARVLARGAAAAGARGRVPSPQAGAGWPGGAGPALGPQRGAGDHHPAPGRVAAPRAKPRGAAADHAVAGAEVARGALPGALAEGAPADFRGSSAGGGLPPLRGLTAPRLQRWAITRPPAPRRTFP